MNMLKKFLWAVIFSTMFVSSGFSEETLQHATGYVKPPIDFSHIGRSTPEEERYFKDKASKFPVSYDLRKLNRVNKTVGNQNPYGTCWAFSMLGAMESNYMTQGLKSLGTTPNLSELHLAWFAYKDPAKGHSFTISKDKGVILNQGGHFLMTSALLSRMSSPVKETSMPYSKAGTNKKKSDSVMKKYVGDKKPSDYFPLALNLKECLFLGSVSNDNREKQKENIKSMISKYGAVQISYYAGEGATSPSGSTTAYFDNSHGTDVDHGVLIVGWNDNFSKAKFSQTKSKRPKNNGAWIVKNSWGKDWGNSGYFYMSYEQYIGSASVFIVEETKKDEKVYYHDALGLSDEFGYGKNKRAYAANVFKATATEGISSVGVYATDNNAGYEIYICSDLGTAKPSSPLSGDAKLVASGTFVNAGYHKVELSQHVLVKKNRYFSVIISMRTPNYDKPIAVERVEKGYSDGAVINSKESYFSSDMKTWTDGTKIKNDNNKVAKSNACIKVFTLSTVAINKTNFPDEKFRNHVMSYCDYDRNGYLTADEINKVTSMYVNNCGISNLKGIERFTALERLNCYRNNLTSLDLKKNTALREINCCYNQITKLDLSKNAALETLGCDHNQIKTLTLGRKTALIWLYCYNNYLTKLDLIGCTELKVLYCYSNKLKTLTLGQHKSLEYLYCSDNQLTNIDVTGCSALRYFDCDRNKLTSLMLSKNTSLFYLDCESNKLTKLNLSKNVNLYYLYCRDNKITKLDLSRCSRLAYWYADYGVQITSPLKIYLWFSNGLENEEYIMYGDYANVSGGTAPYKWKKTGILPSGLKLTYSGDNNENVKLSGTPKKAGTYTFKLTVTDAKKVTISQEFTIVIYPAPSKSSKSSQRDSSQNFTIENNFNGVENFDTVETETHGHSNMILTPAKLKISSDDILWQGSDRDEDFVKVKANSPVKFIIGDWLKPDGTVEKISPDNIQIFVDDKFVEGIEISDEKIFTLPADFVHDDFRVGVKAKIYGNEFESDELYISAED